MEDSGPILLATIATASAALVAIVGGLLVSRVVSLATERSGLLHRRDELEARIGLAESRHQELSSDLRRWDSADVVEESLDELAKLPDEPDIEKMIREASVNRTVDEVAPAVEHALTRMREARETLEPFFEEGHPDELLYELREAGKVDFPPEQWMYYDAMWDQLVDELPKRQSPFGPGIDPSALRGLDDATRINRQLRDQSEEKVRAQLRRDVDDARHQLDALRLERDQLDAALTRVEHPSGIGSGVAVLGYFALVGILFPLAVIARLETIPAWLQWTSIGLFATAVVALLAYVTLSIQRMSATTGSSDPLSVK